jgi:transcriptional regulator with XRE-family HTH domain
MEALRPAAAMEETPMPERFGDALRKRRKAAGKTLSDVAGLLEVSVVYVSDVERGNRRPFNTDRITKVAKFLKTDAAPLIAAADQERGVIEYDITKARPLEADVVGGLVSGLARGGVTDDQLRRIRGILRKGSDDNA